MYFPISRWYSLLSRSNQLTHVSLHQSAVGAATGSEAWNASAASDKQAGIDAMKAASENRDANRDGFGKVEEMAGKAAGCEGMEKEGAASKTE